MMLFLTFLVYGFMFPEKKNLKIEATIVKLSTTVTKVEKKNIQETIKLNGKPRDCMRSEVSFARQNYSHLLSAKTQKFLNFHRIS